MHCFWNDMCICKTSPYFLSMWGGGVRPPGPPIPRSAVMGEGSGERAVNFFVFDLKAVNFGVFLRDKFKDFR